jgi:hypothetical protein
MKDPLASENLARFDSVRLRRMFAFVLSNLTDLIRDSAQIAPPTLVIGTIPRSVSRALPGKVRVASTYVVEKGKPLASPA